MPPQDGEVYRAADDKPQARRLAPTERPQTRSSTNSAGLVSPATAGLATLSGVPTHVIGTAFSSLD
jgi:hypothetical protein